MNALETRSGKGRLKVEDAMVSTSRVRQLAVELRRAGKERTVYYRSPFLDDILEVRIPSDDCVQRRKVIRFKRMLRRIGFR